MDFRGIVTQCNVSSLYFVRGGLAILRGFKMNDLASEEIPADVSFTDFFSYSPFRGPNF